MFGLFCDIPSVAQCVFMLVSLTKLLWLLTPKYSVLDVVSITSIGDVDDIGELDDTGIIICGGILSVSSIGDIGEQFDKYIGFNAFGPVCSFAGLELFQACGDGDATALLVVPIILAIAWIPTGCDKCETCEEYKVCEWWVGPEWEIFKSFLLAVGVYKTCINNLFKYCHRFKVE